MSDVSSARADERALTDRTGLPAFPNWRPWTLDDRHMIERLTATLDAPYSDVHFASCFAWDSENEARWTTLNGNLVMQLPDYATREPVTVLAGARLAVETALVLLDQPDIAKLSLVPECVAVELSADPRLSVTPDRDNFDYVYDLAESIALDGRRWRAIRQQRTRFLRENPEYETIVSWGVENRDPVVRAEVLDVFEQWTEGSHGTDPKAERAALVRLLDYVDAFDIQIVRIHIGGQAVGFSIDELLPRGWACGHFEKANRTTPGLYVQLRIRAYEGLVRRGAVSTNGEQDLGLPGLLKSKLGQLPDRMLSKFIVTPSAL